MLQIFTIGYGSRSREEFLNLLSKHRIDLLVDIRRWPSSKNMDFKGEEMKCWLREAGIGYIWMGEELGGYRRGGYRRYLSSDSFRRGIDQLLSLAKESRVCIMCLEVSPLGCHRRYISQHLNSLGIKTIHIISETKTRDSITPKKESDLREQKFDD